MGGHPLDEYKELKTTHQNLISETLEKKGKLTREEKWTERIAVGSRSFVKDIKNKLGFKGKYRPISKENESWEIREEIS